MTIALVIAVLVIAVLAYLLVNRKPEAVEQPDLAPAIQEAAHEATSRAMDNLLKMNEELRRREAETASETLDKRQAEIRRLAERIAKGQERIDAQVRSRGEADLQTKTLLEQMGQTIGNLNNET